MFFFMEMNITTMFYNVHCIMFYTLSISDKVWPAA